MNNNMKKRDRKNREKFYIKLNSIFVLVLVVERRRRRRKWWKSENLKYIKVYKLFFFLKNIFVPIKLNLLLLEKSF